MSLSKEVVASGNFSEVANFFLEAVPGKSPQEAVKFLESVIDCLPAKGNKRARTEGDSVSAVASSSTLAETLLSIIQNDAIDSTPMTLAIQIPEDVNLISQIIGPKGTTISRLSIDASARIQVEKAGSRAPDAYRHVFFLGPISAAVKGYQLLQQMVLDRNGGQPAAGVSDATRIVIPNEIVAHVIGKGGHLIKELTEITGIQRVDIMQEQDMLRQVGGFYGRSACISGPAENRLHAVYLLLRQLAQDRLLPSQWKGELPPVVRPGPSLGAQAALGGYGGPINAPPAMPFPGAPTNRPPVPPAPAASFSNFMQPLPVIPGLGGMGGIPGEPTSISMNVPADKSCIGAIIGPKGRSIDEMQTLSGCKITLDKTTEGTAVSERALSIAGPSQAHVARAIELVNTRVAQWRRNYTTASPATLGGPYGSVAGLGAPGSAPQGNLNPYMAGTVPRNY